MRDAAVKAMFETIARTYDFQNSSLSLGQDILWRRALARSILVPDRGLVLDVAVGTAEVALSIARHHPGVRVAGVDFSPSMLAIGKAKVDSQGLGDRIFFATGDGRRLPVGDRVADALTIAFGIRNIEERHLALAEFHRVLKPGGRLHVMEFSYPETPVLAGAYRFYFNRILPSVGNWLSRTDYAYSYLADSVNAFPPEADFLDELSQAGFGDLSACKLTFGIAKIFSGSKGKP